MRTIAWLALLGACAVDDPDGSGIAVGNPPKTALARIVVAEGTDVTMTALDLPLDGIYIEDCDGSGEIVEQSEGAFLGLGDTFAIPAGEYCGLGLVPGDEPVVLEGDAGEGSFRFADPLGRILLFSEAPTVFASDESLVLELGEPGWIEATDFGLGPGKQRQIGGPDCVDEPLCAKIRWGLTDRAGLYRDNNGDGRIDEPERNRGADASGNGRR